MRVAEMDILECEYCGKQFERYKWRTSKHVFCDNACRLLYKATNIASRLKGSPAVEVTCDYCGKRFKKLPSTIRPHVFCSKACMDEATKAGILKRDATLTSKHMKQMNTPDYDSSASAYVYNGKGTEHRQIAEKVLGRKLRPDECVHHIDFNKANNSLDNLVVLTNSEHARLHALERLGEPYEIQAKPLSDLCDEVH